MGGGDVDLYQRMSDRSMAKLYWIARHCGDFATANEILQALRQRSNWALSVQNDSRSRPSRQLYCQS